MLGENLRLQVETCAVRVYFDKWVGIYCNKFIEANENEGQTSVKSWTYLGR